MNVTIVQKIVIKHSSGFCTHMSDHVLKMVLFGSKLQATKNCSSPSSPMRVFFRPIYPTSQHSKALCSQQDGSCMLFYRLTAG